MSWIKRKNSSIYFFYLVTSFVGCSHKHLSIYIDVDQCIEIEKLDSKRYHPVKVSFPSHDIRFPFLPQDTTFKNADEIRLKNIKEIINENMEKSFQSLLKELDNIYLQELKQFSKEKKQDLLDEKEKWSKDKYLRIREIFMRYAPQHGKNLWQIALIGGFPDTLYYFNARSMKSQSERMEKQKLDQLIKENKKLDMCFRKDVEELINQINLCDQELKNKLIKEMEQKREKAHKIAYNNAILAIKSIKTQIKDIRNIDYSLLLPEIKENKVYIPSINKKIKFNFEQPSLCITNKELYLIQSQIWAKSCGYILTSNKNCINKTKEFLQWKKKYELETITNR